jgi:hypothetical protein
MIGGGQTTDRMDHMTNFFHFNNQQSSLDNRQSDGKSAVRWLTHTGREVPPSGLKPNSQAALRAVGPFSPPAPFSPGQSPGGEGGPSGCRSLSLANISVRTSG